MTSQLLSVHVPHSKTDLQLGSSTGGPGISLATAGDVLFDSVGVMDIQSKGPFVGQTTSALSMLSASIQKVHSQGKVELFAGGGKAPSSSGPGGPAGAPDDGRPGAKFEVATTVACTALSARSAAAGLKDAFSPQLALVAPSLVGKAIAVGAGLAVAGGAGTAIAGWAGAGAGAPDIEERAKSNIKMVAGKKISGIAPMIIGSQTLGKWEVKALLSTDFTTTIFTNFALVKWEVKALDAFKTISSIFEIEADAKFEVKTKEFKGKAAIITMDGNTTVEKVMDVEKATTCKSELLVEHDTKMHDKLIVEKDTEVKGTFTVTLKTKINSNMTVDGKVKTDTVEFKSSVTLGA